MLSINHPKILFHRLVSSVSCRKYHNFVYKCDSTVSLVVSLNVESIRYRSSAETHGFKEEEKERLGAKNEEKEEGGGGEEEGNGIFSFFLPLPLAPPPPPPSSPSFSLFFSLPVSFPFPSTLKPWVSEDEYRSKKFFLSDSLN